MDENNSLTDDTADSESFHLQVAEDQPVKEVDENWQRYVASSWWWGWYS